MNSVSKASDLQDNWLTIAGEIDNDKAFSLKARAEKRMQEKGYTFSDVECVRLLKLKLVDGSLAVGKEDLEKLRQLCKLWDVDLRPFGISSHRKFIGPIIVAAKKIVYPFVRAILKDTLKQQREFNAASISLLAEVLNRQNKTDKDS